MRGRRLRTAVALLTCAVLTALPARRTQAQTLVSGGARDQNGSAVVRVPGADWRIVAGTSWAPDRTPVRAYHATSSTWSFMGHGSAALGFVWEPTPRGGARVAGFNWLGAHASGPAGGGMLTLNAMGSLETLTLGDCGTPRLLFVGPACASDLVGDFQHAHPPIMELAARYDRPLGRRTAVQLYAALAGDPALGPPIYLHRQSSSPDPVAPITSHETTMAHASGIVVTTGLVFGPWKVEGSLFGRGAVDPDRLLPPLEKPTSLAARVSVNPGPEWSLQASVGRIAADAGHRHGHGTGGDRLMTYSVSASHHRPLHQSAFLATTAAAAYSHDVFGGRIAGLVESSLTLRGGHNLFARAEAARRLEVREHVVHDPGGPHLVTTETVHHRLGQFSAGYLLESRVTGASVGIGARGSIAFVPSGLEPLYLRRFPIGLAVFASIRPPLAAASAHHAHPAKPD